MCIHMCYIIHTQTHTRLERPPGEALLDARQERLAHPLGAALICCNTI